MVAIDVFKNNVGKSITLNTNNGQHECGFIMPFLVGGGVDWLRLIKVSTLDVPVYRGSIFDVIDRDAVIINDIDILINDKSYAINYIRIADITRFTIHK